MKRRDFNRFALGVRFSPMLANAQLFGQTEALAQEPRQDGVLELDDLQHIVITRVPALTGRYEFLTFREAAQGRAWLQEFSTRSHGSAGEGFDRTRAKMDIRCIYLARTSRARGERTGTGNFSGRSPAGYGGARGSAW